MDEAPRRNGHPRDRAAFVLFGLGLLLCGAMTAHLYSSAVRDQYSLKVHENYRVDVNRASTADLELLPGIDRSLARLIFEERRRAGHFRDGGDLQQRVRGIGPKIAEDLEELTCYGRDAPGPSAEQSHGSAASAGR